MFCSHNESSAPEKLASPSRSPPAGCQTFFGELWWRDWLCDSLYRTSSRLAGGDGDGGTRNSKRRPCVSRKLPMRCPRGKARWRLRGCDALHACSLAGSVVVVLILVFVAAGWARLRRALEKTRNDRWSHPTSTCAPPWRGRKGKGSTSTSSSMW